MSLTVRSATLAALVAAVIAASPPIASAAGRRAAPPPAASPVKVIIPPPRTPEEEARLRAEIDAANAARAEEAAKAAAMKRAASGGTAAETAAPGAAPSTAAADAPLTREAFEKTLAAAEVIEFRFIGGADRLAAARTALAKAKIATDANAELLVVDTATPRWTSTRDPGPSYVILGLTTSAENTAVALKAFDILAENNLTLSARNVHRWRIPGDAKARAEAQAKAAGVAADFVAALAAAMPDAKAEVRAKPDAAKIDPPATDEPSATRPATAADDIIATAAFTLPDGGKGTLRLTRVTGRLAFRATADTPPDRWAVFPALGLAATLDYVPPANRRPLAPGEIPAMETVRDAFRDALTPLLKRERSVHIQSAPL